MAGSKLMLAIVLTGLATSVHCADDLDSLDEDFLSYLAELEGEDDDWTIVEPPPPADAKPAKAASSDKPKTSPVKPSDRSPSAASAGARELPSAPSAGAQEGPPQTSKTPTIPDDGSKR